MKKAFLIFCFFIVASSANAFEEQPIYSEEEYSIDTIYDQITNYTKTPEGGVDWAVFSKTTETTQVVKRDGEDWHFSKPTFTEDLQKLNGQKVRLSGYMFPLEDTEEQKHFLFGPFPLTCPYHYHTPLSLVIEVNSDTPISFNYDPIVIEGILELVPEDIEYNVFYRLNNTIEIKD